MPYRFWGGPEVQIFQLAQQLEKDTGTSTELILYTSPSTTDDDLKLVKQKAEQYQIKITLRSSPRLLGIFSERKFLAKFIKTSQIQLAVSTGYACDLLLAGQKVKKISVVHGWTAQNLKIKFYEFVARELLHSFNAVACVSVAQQKYLQNQGLIAQLVSNAFDSSGQRPPRIARDELLKSLNISTPAILLLSIGRLSSEKGHAFALSAFQQIAIKEKNIHWIFIGDGPEEARLMTMVQTYQLNSYVHFLGKRAQARRYMSACDYFVLPSEREGLPVVLLEAFHEMLPVIATSVGGNSELVIDQQTGLLVESKNIEQLANRLEWIISHPTEAKKFSKNAFAHLQNNFSLNKQSEQWQEIIRDVLSK